MKRRQSSTPTITYPTGIIQSSQWTTAYNGYGSVTWDSSGVRFLPKAAIAPDETHAVMILKNNTSLKDFSVKIKAKTLKQLRNPPNAWECFWFCFNYAIAADGKKTANYIVLKPNGFELGTMDGEIGQKFLLTTSAPKLTVGTFNLYEVTKTGKNLKVVIDGVELFNRTFDSLYDQAGTFGLYSEDAECLVESVT